MAILDVMPFRITRNADVERESRGCRRPAGSGGRGIAKAPLRQKAVRLEHGPKPNAWVLQFLMQELSLREEDVYEMPGELDYQDLKPISDLNIPQLALAPWMPVVPAPWWMKTSIFFNVVRKGTCWCITPTRVSRRRWSGSSKVRWPIPRCWPLR